MVDFPNVTVYNLCKIVVFNEVYNVVVVSKVLFKDQEVVMGIHVVVYNVVRGYFMDMYHIDNVFILNDNDSFNYLYN